MSNATVLIGLTLFEAIWLYFGIPLGLETADPLINALVFGIGTIVGLGIVKSGATIA